MGRRPNGALEQEVLAGLWAAGRPIAAQELVSVLPRPLAYTTVMTTLTRLLTKGLVTRSRDGRAWVFAPAGGPGQAEASKMRALVDAAADPGSVLASFVAELAPEQVEVLRAALEGGPR